jgi:hypothetical protein
MMGTPHTSSPLPENPEGTPVNNTGNPGTCCQRKRAPPTIKRGVGTIMILVTKGMRRDAPRHSCKNLTLSSLVVLAIVSIGQPLPISNLASKLGFTLV